MKQTIKLALLGLIVAPAIAFGQSEGSDNSIDVTDEQMDAFRVAVYNAGCTIDTDPLAAAVENATGYSTDLLGDIVAQLRTYEEVVDASTEGGFTLVSGDCAQ